MPFVAAPAKILVTGASGFIATHVVKTLLDSGYDVIGTVRSQSKGEYLTKVFGHAEKTFSFVIVPDIAKDNAFDEAVKGVDAIVHTASPFDYSGEDPAEYIEPALAGTLGVLKSAAAYGPTVKRVVITASLASIGFGKPSPYNYTENDWNETSITAVEKLGSKAANVDKYCAGKTMAERAAWKFIEDNGSKVGFDLSVINPPWIFGPILQEVNSVSALNTSSAKILDTIRSPASDPDAAAECQGGYVDARDCAMAHVLALQKEQAGGKRFIVTSEMWCPQDIYDVVRSTRLEWLPSELPSYAVNKATWDTQDHSQVVNVLGLTFRPLLQTVADTLASISSRFPSAF